MNDRIARALVRIARASGIEIPHGLGPEDSAASVLEAFADLAEKNAKPPANPDQGAADPAP